MNDFDPGAVPPATDPLADPAEVELKERLEAARALLDGLRPITNPGRFLEPDAVEAAVLLREHDVAYFFALHEELRPHRVLRIWLRAVAAAAKGLAEGEQKIAEKTRLIALATERLELFHDQANTAWCWPKEHGPACCWRVPSKEVRLHLLRAYGERHQLTLEDGRKVPCAPGKQAVAEAMDQLEAIAHGAPRRAEPALRVGGDAGRIVIDLCNDDYAVVVVTPADWQVVKPSPIPMRRVDGMYPLPMPVTGAGDALAELRKLLGFDGDDTLWAQLVGFQFACLRPQPPYFVLGLFEEQGRGKTTTGRVLRYAVDPHEVEKAPKPKSVDDLYVNAYSQRLCFGDNISALSQDLSDAHCCISTGATHSKRELYTDFGVVRLKLARPQIITAIVDVVASADLLDRALVARLPELAEPADEEELLAAAAALTPRVLGQLLDAAVLALRDYGKTKLEERVRMVGPTRWVEAGATALGLEAGKFLEAYLESARHAHEIALEASLVGAALRRMLTRRDVLARVAADEGQEYVGPLGFEGTVTELLDQLNEETRTEPRPPGWPRTPRSASGQLRRIAPALRKLGYRVEFTREGSGDDQQRIITIHTAHSFAARSARVASDRSVRSDRSAGDYKTARGDDHITAQRNGRNERNDRKSPAPNEGRTNARAPAAGVPFMITGAQRAELRRRGLTEEQIRGLKPREAHAILAASAGARPDGDADLGQRVRAAREAAGLSQSKLAQLAGTHQPTVSQLEGGREVNPEVAARVRAALGI